MPERDWSIAVERRSGLDRRVRYFAPQAQTPVKILLVDDSADSLRALEAVLDELGESLVRVGSAQEALGRLLKEDFALVLLDARMPDMDGFEAAGLIRTQPRLKDLPIIFVTGLAADAETLERAYRLGASDFITKPLRPAVLQAKVRTFVELYRHRRGLEALVQERTREVKRAIEEIHRLNSDLEKRVAQRTASLEELLREIDTFAYSVAHDLRAPLRAIRGFSEALLDDFARDLPEMGKEYANRMGRAAEKMDALIQGLLAYSRLTREKVEIGPVDLDALVDGALREMSLEIEERKAEVRIEKPLGQVLAHKLTLSQTVINLLSNAVKFVDKDVVPRIKIRAEPRDARMRLWIEDNGIGIPPEHHERIFGVFQRLGKAEAYPGTGIGLAIVRRAMERVGGRVGVESEAGRGSRFWVELPKPQEKEGG